ncbi:MAG: isoaspartyl peptidase/L-asparaginase [Planctomycetes bacterium]|nr:isoaspartyl peptidase/L-asparaginase [Planctomycetota bacterium]
MTCGIVVHGGVGSPPAWADGCRRAAQKGRSILERGGSALDAVIEVAVDLEDDGRFNAGTGSQLRLDGATIEMDAALMTSEARMGGVAAIQRVRNPILVAREVMKTPHVLLAGEGALEFARRCGFADYYQPTPAVRERYDRIRAALEKGGEDVRAAWRSFDIQRYWNFATRYEDLFGCDTIGAVAVDREGRLAVANSTGGASPMLRGRVGDSPLVGCGFYAGPAAAVAATGIGEEIIRRMLCRQVHDWIAQGEGIARACERGIAQFPQEVPVGMIGISRSGSACAANREMAWAEIL